MNLPKACPPRRKDVIPWCVLFNRGKIKESSIGTNEPIKIRDALLFKSLFDKKVIIGCENLNWVRAANSAYPRRYIVVRSVVRRQRHLHNLGRNAANLLVERVQGFFG